jgi:hypothetical protein
VNLDQTDPIVIADSGPLIRLAAAGLLDAIRLTNRQIVMVDRIETEVCEDLSKPYAREIADWIVRSGDAIKREKTVEGAGIAALQAHAASPQATDRDRQDLKKKIRNSGERAIREYVESIGPSDFEDVLVLYEDDDVPRLMQAAKAALTMMTTRAFAKLLTERGYNRDAARALEETAKIYNLKPVIVTTKEPSFVDEEAERPERPGGPRGTPS